jgi:hypothetical protein
MPVGLSPAAAPTIKFKSIAISVSYPNLSTLSFPPKAARAAGYLPNERRLISVSARCAEGKSSPSIDTPSRTSRSGVVSTEVEVSS